MDKKQLEAREALAFSITAAFDADKSNEVLLDEWRGGSVLRSNARNIADKVIAGLEKVGVRLAVSSTPRLEKFLEDLITIPATKAYTLEEEVAAPPPLGASQAQ